MRRLVIAAAIAATGLLPSGAFAAVKQIDIAVNSNAYCIAVDNGPSSVTFTAIAPGGGTLASASSTSTVAGQNCAGTVTAGVTAFHGSLSAFPGATVVADAGGGVSTSFVVPYGAYDASGSTGIVKIAGLPNAGGTLSINGGGSVAYSGAGYTTPSAIAVGSGAVSVTSTVSGVPYLATLQATQFKLDTEYYGRIYAYGTDPLGAPISMSVSAGGAPFVSTTIAPAVDNGQQAQGSFPVDFPSGSVVTVTQPGWFSHTVTFGSIALRPTGFDVSVPAVAGESGHVSVGLSFQKTTGLLPGDPLSCLYFGDASYMLTNCSSATARYSATFPAIVSVEDYAEIYTTEADGDTSGYEARPPGFSTDLADGSVFGESLGSVLPISLTATTPSHVTATQNQVTYEGGYVSWSEADGPNTYLPLHIVNGTSFVASGPALGSTPGAFSVNLQATITGPNTISGTTYPGANLEFELERPSAGSTTYYATADGNGAFTATVGALLGGDYVYAYAHDPASFNVSEDFLVPGLARPTIAGVSDQQLVHGTISATAASGGPSGVFWNGDVPGALVPSAPYAYSLDTTKLPDGPYRLEADTAGAPQSLEDYLYLRVDNTAPTVSAGPNQTIAVGHNAVLLASAHDANGIASLTATFGDGKSLSVPAASIGQPIAHVYAKGGTYTATLKATDAAGNVASSTATIRVTSTLASQVSGKVQKTLKRHKALKVKFTSHLAGVLSVHVYDAKAKLRGSKLLTFTKANQKSTLSVATKKWKTGRYTFVLQFTDANGTPGPVVVTQLRIT